MLFSTKPWKETAWDNSGTRGKGMVPLSLQSKLQSETNSLIASSNFLSTIVISWAELRGLNTSGLRQSCFQHYDLLTTDSQIRFLAGVNRTRNNDDDARGVMRKGSICLCGRVGVTKLGHSPGHFLNLQILRNSIWSTPITGHAPLTEADRFFVVSALPSNENGRWTLFWMHLFTIIVLGSGLIAKPDKKPHLF